MTHAESPGPSRRAVRARQVLRAGLLLALVAGIIALQQSPAVARAITSLVQWGGYTGLLGAAALSGFNLAVPVPVIAFYPSLVAAGLDPVLTVLVIAVGMTIGDAVAIVLGVMGRHTIRPPDSAFVRWAETVRVQHPERVWIGLTAFAAFVPLPNETVILPLAYLGFRPAGIVACAFVGHVVFNALAALGLLQLVGH
jgi:membrane protein YqaA with SNARE-associated domain